MLSDLRNAFRLIAKSPGYAIVIVLTLAFGISVNTVIFGMINVFLLRPMPVPDAGRVVLLLQRSDVWNMPHEISFADFKDYRARVHTIEHLMAFMPNPVNLSAEGQSPERTWVEVVTPDAFQAMAIPPLHGRTLLPSDGEAAGGANVIMLSYSCWQTRFGGDPAVVGTAVVVNGRPFTVVGVAPETFVGFSSFMKTSGFVPTGAIAAVRDQGAGLLEWRGATAWRVMGRLAPAATLSAASAEVAVVTQQLATSYPDDHHGVRSLVLPEYRARPHPIMSDFLPMLIALFVGMVALVMAIACANVANLMFARAAMRQREFSMRAALGASRWRLIRQMLVESVVLAALAGVCAQFFSVLAGTLLARFSSEGDIPVVSDFSANWRDYAFAVLISLVAGIASGLPPALRASRVDLIENLKESGGRVAGGRHWLRNGLVLGQVTFSLVVLTAAALFLRSLQRVQEVDLGFRADHLLMASFDLKLQGYDDERARQFNQQVIERVRALPGVDDATLSSHVPFDYNSSILTILPENPPAQLKDGTVATARAFVAPGYFATMKLRLRRGRTLTASDTAQTPTVAVVNQTLVDMCWPGSDGIGRRFQPWKNGPWIEVVGVMETAKYIMVAEPPRPFYYGALAQESISPVTLLVRTSGQPASYAAAIRAAVRELDPHLPLYSVRTMEELMGSSIFAFMPVRMGSTLAGIQGAIGLLLAVMGLYAVVSFGVTQRTREIGIRVALGARPRNVVFAVLREGLWLTGVGLAIGILLAAGLGFGMSKLLYGLAVFDPLLIAGVTLVLIATAALACWWPAHRATKVDPAVALRAD